MFGMDTRKIREVLGIRVVQRIPLAPRYIAGAVSYRGEVLTTVSLRALLGLSPTAGETWVMVLDGETSRPGKAEPFGLMVDAVGGVTMVMEDLLRENPPTLPESYRGLCCGAFRTPEGLLVELDPERLRPERLEMRTVGRAAHKALDREIL
jgi:purine-binding chemotaxis protein CheW